MKFLYRYLANFFYPPLLLLPLILVLPAIPESLDAKDLPRIDGIQAVAAVDGDPISVAEFKRALVASHAESFSGPQPKMAGDGSAGRIDYQGLLKRLVNIRLILREARNMGLYELPRIEDALQTYAGQTLAELLLENYVGKIQIEDDAVQPLYQDAVRQWKIKSVLFKTESAARQMKADLEAGGDFDRLARQAVEKGVAEAEKKGAYIENQELTRPMARLVADMAVGEISPIVSTGKKEFIIFKLEDLRYPEEIDAQAWKDAEKQALKEKKIAAAWEYSQQLKAQYAVVHQEVVDGLDYAADEPGIEQLLEDRRVLVDIRGEAPITVADLTRALEQKFYHGVQQAIDGGRINAAKGEKLESMIQQRVLRKEARRRNFDETEEYSLRVGEYERSLVFGMFVEKVIAPDVKLTLKELEDYYQNNIAEFSSPKMVRINALVFRKQNDALDAVNKLTRGTDFKWLAANAGGQVDRGTPGLLRFDGRLLTVTSLPEDLQETLADAGPGNVRLYAAPRGYYYVLYVDQIRDPAPRPFETVKNEIAQTVYNAKLKDAVEAWADKLKEYYPVKIYLTDIEQL